MTAKKKKSAPKKPRTPEQREAARARHWRRTGVSEATVRWMKDTGWL